MLFRSLRAGAYDRLVWLTGKSTGQIQVMHTLRQMTTPEPSNTIRDNDPAPHGDARGLSNVLYYKSANGAVGVGGAGERLAVWQVRNKREHCVNGVFHCVRDACGYLAGGVERWAGSGEKLVPPTRGMMQSHRHDRPAFKRKVVQSWRNGKVLMFWEGNNRKDRTDQETRFLEFDGLGGPLPSMSGFQSEAEGFSEKLPNSLGFAVSIGVHALMLALLLHVWTNPRSEEHTSELQSH